MRVVFLGSGAFAIPSFEALLDAGHAVAALVTQPDKEKGRGRAVGPPPLKPVAEARGVPVLQPRRIREAEAQRAVRELAADVHVVVAYGQILPAELIDAPRLRTLNVHASLLPRYRGAAPIQWAIVRGETETGVSVMRIDAGLDTGPVLLQRRLAIGPEETAGELEPRLARLGADALVEALAGLQAGTLAETPQDGARASHAPILRKADGRLDWSRGATALACQVRGLNPWPGAFTLWNGARLAVWRAVPSTDPVSAPPGTLGGRDGGARLVACGDGRALALVEVQPEGRKRMTGAAFALGARPGPQAVLG